MRLFGFIIEKEEDLVTALVRTNISHTQIFTKGTWTRERWRQVLQKHLRLIKKPDANKLDIFKEDNP